MLQVRVLPGEPAFSITYELRSHSCLAAVPTFVPHLPQNWLRRVTSGLYLGVDGTNPEGAM